MDISGQVLAVTGRNVNVTKGPRPGAKVIYDVQFSDGNTWTTWKAETATKAMQLQQSGAQADLRGEITVNGEFTNYKLLDIAPTGQLEAVGALLSPSQPVGNGGAPTIPTIPIVASQGGMSPERESKIVKQSCLSTAFNFVGQAYPASDWTSLDEAIQAGLALAHVLYAEVYGQENVAATPELIAAQVNAVVPESVSVGADTPPW